MGRRERGAIYVKEFASLFLYPSSPVESRDRQRSTRDSRERSHRPRRRFPSSLRLNESRSSRGRARNMNEKRERAYRFRCFATKYIPTRSERAAAHSSPRDCGAARYYARLSATASSTAVNAGRRGIGFDQRWAGSRETTARRSICIAARARMTLQSHE